MNLFILGATGGIGSALVRQALERGHSVTAFVRSPQKMTGSDRLAVVGGDPSNLDQISAAIPGHDAVLSALGPRSLRESRVLQDCARTTVAAMKTAAVDRLVIVSASALFPDAGLIPAIIRRTLLSAAMDDAAAMEQIVRSSGLRWTIARPPRLTNGPGTGHYRAVVGHPAPRAFSMDRPDVARFMLNALDGDAYIGDVVGLGR